MMGYKNFSIDQLEEHFSNFLIDSWSFSGANTFSRNEKAFEMQYIYRQRGKSPASTIAGQAYHDALEDFFTSLADGQMLDLSQLHKTAFNSIDETPANYWKLQKTTPTIEDCITKANKIVTVLLNNFYAERATYLDEIEEILHVEEYLNEWISLNGVEIPLPCHLRIDLVIRTKDGRIIIIDHKSKASYTDEKDVAFVIGKQAITYALGYESKFGVKVDEVWFIENKHSMNKDKSPQLSPNKVILDTDTKKLYEAMLYEPVKRMIEAVSNPDYVYLINDMDNLTDKAELFEFWMQTMIAEVDDFNIQASKREMISKRLRKVRDSSLSQISPSVIKNFKQNAASFISYDLTNSNMNRAEKIEHVLRTFGKPVQVEHEFKGVSSDTYLLSVSAGLTITSLYKHRLDIANALNVSNIRIGKDLFVHEGKSYISVEAAKNRETILFYDEKYLDGFKIPIGLDNMKNIIYWDLNNPSTPHMLVGGATGSGKSVSLISTISYAILAGVKEIHLFDPKYEFVKIFSNNKNVFIYSDIDDIEAIVGCLVDDMQERVKTGKVEKTLVVFDEFADAIANSKKGKDLNVYEDQIIGQYKNGLPKTKRVQTGTIKSLEENIRMLAQKGRSTGYNIILSTQRASTKVITGDAKVNFPVQVCFRVPKEIDSRVMIDDAGAESLAGQGDGLIKSPEYKDTVRFQAFFKP